MRELATIRSLFANRLKQAGVLAALLFSLVHSSGCSKCSGDGCTTSSDCDLGQLCISGDCILPISDTDSESDTDTSNHADGGPTDTATETDSTSDSESDSDVDTDSDSDSVTDTDTPTEPRTGLPHGSACDSDEECLSIHCGGGFCCPSGECCSSENGVLDCDQKSCVARYCTGDRRCVYSATNFFGCAVPDGDICSGASLCDGQGSCVAVDGCNDGPYAHDSTYACAPGSVSENCYKGCSGVSHCNDGYECVSGECSAPCSEFGEECDSDAECCGLHCSDGICCSDSASGECCTEAADCDLYDSCAVRNCNGNSECVYQFLEDEHGSCGVADSIDAPDDPGICNGASRCDGFGNCVELNLCDGAFGPIFGGEYDCEYGLVQEACWEMCWDNDQCNPGYYCDDGGDCVSLLDDGTAGCREGGDCLSGYCNNTVCCRPDNSEACCVKDSDCGAVYPGSVCDDGGVEASWSCIFSCEGSGGIEDDDLCQQGYHCEKILGSYECWEDQINGNLCNENSDCDSGYCDAENNVCCDGGSCCNEDADCSGGFACENEFDFSCFTDCNPTDVVPGGEIDGRCADQRHCDGSSCLWNLVNGSSGCDEASDCSSGNCTASTGVCCSSGAPGNCCNDSDQCDDVNACTADLCDGDFHCQTILLDSVPCPDTEYCDGVERCEKGECKEVADEPCGDLDGLCRVGMCRESTPHCYWLPVNDSDPCSEPMGCLAESGGEPRPKICDNGLCVNPPNSGPCGVSTNECTEIRCEEDTEDPYYNCIEESIGNGLRCEGPCNNVCWGGNCVEWAQSFCAVVSGGPFDPCVDYGSSPFEGSCECGGTAPKTDGDWCYDGQCMGDNPYCLDGECIPDDVAPCDDNDLCDGNGTQVEVTSCINHTPAQCFVDSVYPPIQIFCNDKGTETRDYFLTKEYNTYGGSCAGQTYIGKETVVVVDLPGSEVTLSVSSVDPPGMTATILHLDDWCDPASCLEMGVGSLTLQGLVPGSYYFAIEIGEEKPNSVVLTATCQ